jgi:hypothetical protein
MGPAHAASDNQRFIVHFAGADNSPGRVVAVGPIEGIGSVVDSDYHPGPGDSFIAKTTLSLPGGTVVLTVRGTHSDTFDPRTCIGSFTDQGQFTIAEAPGGMAGTGRVTSRGWFFAPRTDQGCAEEGGTEVVLRDMTGTVYVPASL